MRNTSKILLRNLLGEAIFQIVLENPLLAIGQKLGNYIHRTFVVELVQHDRRLLIPDPSCIHDLTVFCGDSPYLTALMVGSWNLL